MCFNFNNRHMNYYPGNGNVAKGLIMLTNRLIRMSALYAISDYVEFNTTTWFTQG